VNCARWSEDKAIILAGFVVELLKQNRLLQLEALVVFESQ
jgi:hypothetical protein